MNDETEKKEVEKEGVVEEVVEQTADVNAENIEDTADEGTTDEANDVGENDEQSAEQSSKKNTKDEPKEVKKLTEEIMRLRAEMDNMKKRNARELDNLRKYSLDKFAKALIPVADSLDKALEVGKDDNCQVTAEQMIEGTEMTQKVFLKVLTENGVQVLDPQGEKFNPEFHEAMTQVPNPELEPNTIVDVFQKGYVLNGRLVRPAMVVVSK